VLPLKPETHRPVLIKNCHEMCFSLRIPWQELATACRDIWVRRNGWISVKKIGLAYRGFAAGACHRKTIRSKLIKKLGVDQSLSCGHLPGLLGTEFHSLQEPARLARCQKTSALRTRSSVAQPPRGPLRHRV